MRKLDMNEISQVSGGAWWSTSNILGFIFGSKDTTQSESWESIVTAPSNSEGMGEAIGKTVVGVAVIAAAAIGAVAMGLLSSLSNQSK